MEVRKDPRHPVKIQARYRTGSGVPRDVAVTDLSQHGCRFFDRHSNLAINQFVSIKIGSIGPIEARVMWREGGVVGLQFDQGIHPGVLDHMRYTLDG